MRALCRRGSRSAQRKAHARAQDPPNFEFFDPVAPIYTSPRFLPPARVNECTVEDAIIAHGAMLEKCTISNAVIGIRSIVRRSSAGPVLSVRLPPRRALGALRLACSSRQPAHRRLRWPLVRAAAGCSTLTDRRGARR